MEGKNTFTVINDEGKEIVCDVLFTFDSDETKKSYVVYTDNTKDEFGNIRVYASIFNPNDNPNDNGNGTELLPIQTEKEWKVIEKILESLQEEVQNASGNSSSN